MFTAVNIEMGDIIMAENEKIELYEDQPIRTAWNETEEEWCFSVVDVVRVLTDSKDPTAYWRKLKQRLKDEGNETVTNCHGLKMTAPDGKKRLTDVATTEQVLRILTASITDENSIAMSFSSKKHMELAG